MLFIYTDKTKSNIALELLVKGFLQLLPTICFIIIEHTKSRIT